ncbi:putative AhpC/Tsa family protein, selenocysteine-containing oxidoreductase [Tepidicaulis marinus]|jgi:peroxiredoxin|uniref:thioredoxin-dependent peroxiredoxin n=1 Tax=Tepidicaulis marinus TaxID=1333998 RepID=A0A081BAL2_9HYPH|nr:peroxiredoxin-like family protein [Tepidicaulis marinus]GAK45080.1 putative AhpC/Tsa family protein, selenocysteine-containing oxidoreductase [Tepidicaulis marinus]
MSLKDELENMKNLAGKRIPADVLDLMEQATKDLAATGIAARAVAKGKVFPGLTLKNAVGKPVNLGQLYTQSPLIVTFYRGAWCPYCNLELRAYQALLPEIKAAGGQLVAVTPELPDGALSSVERHGLEFEVLSDEGLALAGVLGITFELPAKLAAVYGKIGNDLPKLNGTEDWVLPLPATYVVGTDGRIALANVEVDYRDRMEPRVALDALKETVAQVA